MFNNRYAILIHSQFFEKDLRKHLNRRCDYEALQSFISGDDQETADAGVRYPNPFNNEDRVNDIVRAYYFHAETVYRDGELQKRKNEGHHSFLNALRSLNYEVVPAYNSIDSAFVLNAIELAQAHVVDTMMLLGLTIDHVPLLWHLRTHGVRVVSMFAKAYDTSERIKDALNWHHDIKVEDGFLTEELPSKDSSKPTAVEEKTEEDVAIAKT